MRQMSHGNLGQLHHLPSPCLGYAGESVEGAQTAFSGQLRDLLSGVSERMIEVDEALDRLRDLPFSDIGFARVDHRRELRQGACEIVYAPGKTEKQLTAILGRLLDVNAGPIIVTRASEAQLELTRELANQRGFPSMVKSRAGSIAILRNVEPAVGMVFIVSAGTGDQPVVEEAELTATALGTRVEIANDVGVAGLHRVTSLRSSLGKADVVIVVAGMEGALASVVGGLVSCPVIACPTSVGYGANFVGLAALLSMLSSCTPGVACVNIDDGVGAGYVAALIARSSGRRRSE